MQTHIDALPTLQALRLCHRFGDGRFKDFPVELVKMIEGYVVEPLREKLAKDLEVASRCFKNECSILDHASRADLLWFYEKWVYESNTRHPEYFQDPTDAESVECLETGIGYDPPDLHGLNEEAAHERNREKWPRLMGQIFSERNRWMFRKRFGLDIWHSFIRLPYNHRGLEEYGFLKPPSRILRYRTKSQDVINGASTIGLKTIDQTAGSGTLSVITTRLDLGRPWTFAGSHRPKNWPSSPRP